MTVSRTRRSIVVDDLEAAVAAVRDSGLRVSAARRLVLESLFEAGRPISAEDIASGLRGRLPRSDLTSVYRNLETLEELGLVRHFHFGHGAGRYALAGADERSYLVCELCGRHDAVDPQRLDRVRAQVREAFGYEASFMHFPVVGICPECQARRDASS